jgi:hypothetical protein
MKITEHFTLQEAEHSDTAKRLGIDNSIPEGLMGNLKRMCDVLESVRSLFNHPVMISSFYRGPELNKKVGGSKTSAHMDCRACDFTVKGVDVNDVFSNIKHSDIEFDQLILESSSKGSTWIHLGIHKDGAEPRRMVMTGSKTDSGSTFRVENG